MRFLPLSALWLLTTGIASAIVDTNENTVSDLWEKQYNNGELYPSTFNPHSDPDQDGWTNAQEAAAGTDPQNPNPPDGLVQPEILHTPAVIGEENGQPVIVTPEVVTVSWPTLVGKQYTLHFSPDLTEENWTTVDEPFIGDGDIHEFNFLIAGAADKRFWRIAVEDADTDGDTLTDSEEHSIGSSPYLADTDGDGTDDATAYASGSDPSGDGSDTDGDGIPDNQLYSVVFEVIHESLSMPSGIGYHSFAESDETNRYLTHTDTETYSVSGSARYPDVNEGDHAITDTWLSGGSINAESGVGSSEQGTSFEDWKANNQVALGQGETLHLEETVTTTGEPTLTATRIAIETTSTTPWTVEKDGEVIRSGTETITVLDEFELSDGTTYPQFWNDHVKDRPWQESQPATFGPLNWMEYNRDVFGDAEAAESIRNHFRNGDFDISGNLSFPGPSPINYGSDERIKILRWRWVRFNPNSPFGYEFATPPASVRKTFSFIVEQRDQLQLRSGANGTLITDETTTKGIVPIEFTATEGTQTWAEIPLTKFAAYKLEDPANLADIDFSKWGGSQVMIGNSPLHFDVFPPEATEGQIANADDDTWEVETFQIAADEPDFWIQANVMTRALGPSASIVPAADGTTVTWEIVQGESDQGATLAEETTETEGGHTAVKLTMPTTPGARVKVRGKVTTLKIPTEVEEESVTLTKPDGFAEVKTQLFEVVPGNVRQISLAASDESVPADGKSQFTVQATLTDAEGNPAARGTDVSWRMSGSGEIFSRDHLIAGQDGMAEAVITAGTLGDMPHTITIEADGVTAEIAIPNTPVSITSLGATPQSLDINGSQTATITVAAAGVADGTAVTWRTSSGALSHRSGTIQNGSAQTVLSADAGTVGTASVIAIVGDAIANCEVQFTSAEPITVEVEQPLLVLDESGNGTDAVPSLFGGSQSIPFAAESPVKIRAPSHPGEWATVGFTGKSGVSGHRWSFDLLDGNASPSLPAGLPATFADGAILETDWQFLQSGTGAVHLPSTTASVTIANAPELILEEGSTISFLIRPSGDAGPILTKSGEYQASLLTDGRLTFILGTGQSSTQVTSQQPLAENIWQQVRVSVDSTDLHLDVEGATASTALVSAPQPGTEAIIIGGITGHLDDLRFSHTQQGLVGISVSATGLDSQNRVQLDANGEATIVVSAETVGQGPPEGSLGQTVDIDVEVDQETVKAKEALTVTDKGTGVLIRAIAGSTAIRPLELENTDIAAHAAAFLKYGIRDADRTASVPKDMVDGAAARGECGYLIAIWMEERVDEAGIVRPLMSVSAQNLPQPVAEVLTMLLSEMMVSASQRNDCFSFAEYIMYNHREFLLALRALSEGDTDEFLQFASVADGNESFTDLSATGNQVGNGLAARVAKTTTAEIGNAYELVRATFNRHNSRIKMLSLSEGFANFHHAIRGPILDQLQEGDDGMEAVLRDLSQALHAADLIDEKTVAAVGTIYGFVHEANELTQEVAHPELFAKALPTLLDILIGAARGEAEAVEALKDIGSGVIMAPVNEFPQAADEWEQGEYFNAGRHYAAAAVGGTLVAKELKRSIQRGVYRCVGHGRKLWHLAGKRGEALVLARFRAMGYRDVVPIQNESGHGIDLIMRDKEGGILAVEVKSHLLSAKPRVKSNMEDFVKSRLAGAKTPEGHWKDVDEKTLENAISFWEDLETKRVKIREIVVNVDYVLTQFPRERYFEWADGLGAEIFENDLSQ
jgi:hypothetical protein